MNLPQNNSLLQTLALKMDYPVIFSRNIFDPRNPALFEVIVRREPERRHMIAVVIDSNVASAWPRLTADIQRYAEAHERHLLLASAPFLVAGGETCKNESEEVIRLQRWMLDAKLDRQSVLLVIGGGAVLDMAGFAAATFHRGIRLLRLPTTVLAQNDAGIGVKNGINRFGIKNLIGSFSVPFAVVSDLDFLSTLDERDKRAGLAEAVKVALIRDRDFFEWLKQEATALADFSLPQTETMIRRCARLHLDHIANGGDPFEQGSARPLDFGHWAAHKLESMSRHQLRHGEAVAIGIALDACYSCETGLLEREQADGICELLQTLGFILWHEVMDSPQGQELLLEGLTEFREHLGGELTLTMLAGIGCGIDIHTVDYPAFKRALATLANRSAI